MGGGGQNGMAMMARRARAMANRMVAANGPSRQQNQQKPAAQHHAPNPIINTVNVITNTMNNSPGAQQTTRTNNRLRLEDVPDDILEEILRRRQARYSGL